MSKHKTKVTRLPVTNKIVQAPQDYLQFRLEQGRVVYAQDPLDGCAQSLAAVTAYLRDIGEPYPQMEALDGLLSAMYDTSRGQVHALFKPADRTHGLTTGEKLFRAMVAALAETLIRRKISGAEDAYRKAASWCPPGSATASQIERWRKDVFSHGSRAYDADVFGLDARQQAQRFLKRLSRFPTNHLAN